MFSPCPSRAAIAVVFVEHDDLASRQAAHHQGEKRGGTDGTRSNNSDSHDRSPFARRRTEVASNTVPHEIDKGTGAEYLLSD
jgi:hypothetical protein